jgi:putative FmdB family regulatory protein
MAQTLKPGSDWHTSTMPTYTYRCQKCGEEFERFQSMSDEPVKRCPSCKGKVQRVFHPVGIVLKGSGFHRNDYRTSKPGSSSSESSSSQSERTEKNEKTEKAEKTEKKTETKSDTKSDGKKADSG